MELHDKDEWMPAYDREVIIGYHEMMHMMVRNATLDELYAYAYKIMLQFPNIGCTLIYIANRIWMLNLNKRRMIA